MKKLQSVVLACWSALSLGGAADASPRVVYDATNGNIQMSNDAGAILPAFYMLSANRNFATDRLKFAIIPHAVFDSGDLPYAFTYLNFPSTGPGPSNWINIGNVVTPGTPIASLTAAYYTSFDPVQGPFFVTADPQGAPNIPEPAAGCLAVTGLIAAAYKRRRRLAV